MKIVGVIGGTVCSAEEYAMAEEVGRLLALEGATVICGGYGGVMEAASKGARESGGTVIGLLSGSDRFGASPYLTVALATGLGEARNAVIARSADALIAVGGEYGTLSEIAFSLKIGKPVFGIGTWQFSRGGEVDQKMKVCSNAQEAVCSALEIEFAGR